MRLIDYYDALVELGRLNAYRVLAEAAHKAPTLIFEALLKQISVTHLERHYSGLLHTLGLSASVLPPWPPKELRDWDTLVAEVDRAIRSNDPNLELYWRIAGYLLWVPAPEENVGMIRDALKELGLALDEINAIAPDLSSSETDIRLSALQRVRRYLRSHGSQQELSPPGDRRLSRTATEVHLVLKALPSKISLKEEKAYLEETLTCYSDGAYRAAIVMCWNLVFSHLCNFILKDPTRLATFNSRLSPKATQIVKYEDFLRLKESQVLETCNSVNLITKLQYKILDQKLRRRNDVAHPSNIKIHQISVEEYVLDLVENVLLTL
jgi:hypothetical protein